MRSIIEMLRITEVGIYERTILRKKERKHAFGQENKDMTKKKRKKTRSCPRKEERKVTKISTKKKRKL